MGPFVGFQSTITMESQAQRLLTLEFFTIPLVSITNNRHIRNPIIALHSRWQCNQLVNYRLTPYT